MCSPLPPFMPLDARDPETRRARDRAVERRRRRAEEARRSLAPDAMKAAVRNRRTSQPVAPSGDAPDAGISDPVEARRRRLAAQGRGMTVLGDMDAPDRAPPGPPLFLHLPKEDATPEQRRRFFARNRGLRVPGPGEEMSSVRLMTFPHGDRLPPFRVDDQARSQQGRSPVPLSSLFRSLEGTIPTSPLQTVQHGQPKNESSASNDLTGDPVQRFPERTEEPPRPSQKRNRPSEEKLDTVERAARLTVEKFREQDWPVAADMMETWLDGGLKPGAVYRVTADWARAFAPVRTAEAEVKKEFENWLNAKEDFEDSNYGFPTIEITDGESCEIGDLRLIDTVWLRDDEAEDKQRRLLDPHRIKRAAWEESFETPLWRWFTDGRNAVGNANVIGVARLELERRGDWVKVHGKILFQLQDRYDWNAEDDLRFPHTYLSSIPAFSPRDLNELERFRVPNSFDVRSEPWTRKLTGRLLVKNGKVVLSVFKWLDP